jgi:hypothetical protein
MTSDDRLRSAALFSVPELTCGAGIKLNARVSLRRRPRALSIAARDITQSPEVPWAKPSDDRATLGGFTPEMTTKSHVNLQMLGLSAKPAWAQTWHLWTVIMPRRSITGRLVFGKVWRRHDGRHWIYKKYIE